MLAGTIEGIIVADRMFTFIGGVTGLWRIVRLEAVAGESLERVPRLDVVNSTMASLPTGAKWLLRGVTSSERYTARHERDLLVSRQPALGRPDATCAALIPTIKKSESWWGLAQDERRAIFEEQSEHIKTGLKYLPAVARRLHHCRDLGEPFDFLTWFEYTSGDCGAFEELVAALRRSKEWRYVEREVDIRLVRSVAA